MAKLAKFILGVANRPPLLAGGHLNGYAVMVLGAGMGSAPGLPAGTEIHNLNAKLEKYLGAEGPQFHLGRVAVSEGREVLFIIVDPPQPGQPPFACHKDFQPEGRENRKHALNDGYLYIRLDSATRTAKGAEVMARRGIVASVPPVTLQVNVLGVAYRAAGTIEYLETVRAVQTEAYKVACQTSRDAVKGRGYSVAALSAFFGDVTPPTATEEEQTVSRYAQRLRDQSEEIVDYYTAVAGDGVGFHVINDDDSYLEAPRLNLIFHGCTALDWEDRADADFDRLVPPVARRRDPFGIPAPQLPRNLHVRNNLVSWQQVGTDMQVTLTPGDLHPRTPWNSDRDDLVLVTTDPDASEVQVTWTATVKGRGEQWTGEQMIPVETIRLNPLVASTSD